MAWPVPRVGGLAGGGVRDGGAGEGEDAVVVQQGFQAILLQIDLRACVQSVCAARGAEDIAQSVDVISRKRAADGVGLREEAGDADPVASDGTPCTLMSEPYAASDLAGLLMRPASIRV